MNNKKYIIRQVAPEHCEFDFYFEGDCFNENAGGFEYTLFILHYDNFRYYGLNHEVFNSLQIQASNMIDDFGYVAGGHTDYDGNKITYKRVMQDYGISYSPTKCAKLKKWAEQDGANDVDGMADYLSITTGRKWETTSARGYCQGDYVDIIYCADIYTAKGAEIAGEIYLGAANEFCVIELDENGKEIDSCYGYFVADCEAWKDEDYKKIVCEYAGIPENETVLEMIDGSYTVTHYNYRTA